MVQRNRIKICARASRDDLSTDGWGRKKSITKLRELKKSAVIKSFVMYGSVFVALRALLRPPRVIDEDEERERKKNSNKTATHCPPGGGDLAD
jgi:hypothetical protein